MYAVQFFAWLGYKNIYAIASGKHHETLESYGAKLCFDYRGGTDEAVKQANDAQQGNPIKYILDCIGSLDGSMRPISKIAKKGAIVALLLPVIIRDAAEGVRPEYGFDVQGSADWADGVITKGVRAFLYLSNPFIAEKGQPEIMPALLKAGVIKPNDQLIVEGETMLERAEKAMSMLRNKVASGQRLVWRGADEAKD